MPAGPLVSALDQTAPVRLIVLGDLMLDQYTHGEAERISQEAPIIVLRATQQQSRPGGAANVANMVQALGGQAWCAGVVGDDEAGRGLRATLRAAGVDDGGILVDPNRPTTRKERFVGCTDGRNAHQILRVDHEVRAPLAEPLERELAEAILARLPACDGLLISDYGKGVCTPALLARVIAAARALGVPVLVDPLRGSDYQRYRGATLLKPNRVETGLVTGTSIQSSQDALAAGRRLCEQLELDLAVVTLDRDGMALVARSGQGTLFATQARAVYDITGAGDMVLSALGVFLCGGLPPHLAVQLANAAAGLEVEQVGVVTVTRGELRDHLLHAEPPASKIVDAQTATVLAEHYRRQGQRVVFTNGCYDLLHAGHVLSLAAAAAEGDVLFVGVNSDRTIRSLKGPQRPIVSEQDRMAVLAALGCVSHVVLFDDATPHALLHAIRPDVLVKGGTYAVSEVVGREVVEAYGGTVRVTPVVDGLSTTRIVESVLAKNAA